MTDAKEMTDAELLYELRGTVGTYWGLAILSELERRLASRVSVSADIERDMSALETIVASGDDYPDNAPTASTRECLAHLTSVRSHIAALTAERDRLAGELAKRACVNLSADVERDLELVRPQRSDQGYVARLEAAERLRSRIAALSAGRTWVPCSARYPEDNHYAIVVYDDDQIGVAWYCTQHGWMDPLADSSDGDIPFNFPVSHWMEMPDLPVDALNQSKEGT